MLKSYVVAAGRPEIALHDLRRTTAKLCRAAGGEIGADPDAAWAFVGADDGMLSRDKAGFGVRADAIKLNRTG
jgi:hypothetical protein